METQSKLTPETYRRAVMADEAWMREIRRAFPNERAGDVRYTPKAKGKPGTTLRKAYREFAVASIAIQRTREGETYWLRESAE